MTISRLGRLALLLALMLAGCRPSAPPRPEKKAPPFGAPSGAPPEGAPVVLTLVVDQLAGWIVAERTPALPADGGFARLRREGTTVRDMRYAYATTDTAPGHAALYTGAVPRQSGIALNEWIDVATGKHVPVLRDASTKVLAADGPHDMPGSSSARLRSETIADGLRRAHPDAVILSFSLKDRAAIFGGGTTPTATLWFEPSLDAFVTSSAYAREFPPWAREASTSVSFRHGMVWTPLDEPWLRRHAATPDAQPGEADLEGFGTTFPHDLGKARRRAVAFRATPFADEALVRLAMAGLDAHRGRDRPVLLALSLSANDYIGHLFGPDSWEAWDELLRLDGLLARLFAALDRRFGPDGYGVLLAADHGVTTLPEAASVPAARPWCALARPDRWQRPCETPIRVSTEKLAQALRESARRALGVGEWVLGVAEPYVYLTPDAGALSIPRRKLLLEALIATLGREPGIRMVIDVNKLPSQCPPTSDDSVEALVCRAVMPGTGGHLYLVPQPGCILGQQVAAHKGVAHGSPYLYDRSVALLARVPGRVAAGRVIDAPLDAAVFARTAAAVFGMAPPAAAAGGVDLTAP